MLLILDVSSFLLHTFNAMNLPLNYFFLCIPQFLVSCVFIFMCFNFFSILKFLF